MHAQRRIAHLWLFQLLADLIALTAAYYSTFLIRFQTQWGARVFESIMPYFGGRTALSEAYTLESFYLGSAPRIIVFVGLTVFTLYALFNLYSGRRFIFARPTGGNILMANLVALFLFYAYFYLSRNVFHPRSFFACLVFLNTVYAIVLRAWMDRFLQGLRRRKGLDRCNAAVVGTSPESNFLCAYIEQRRPHGIQLTEKIDVGDNDSTDTICQRIRQAKAKHNLDLIILGNKSFSVGEIMRVLQETAELDLATKVLTDKLDVLIIEAHMPVDMVQGVPLLHFDAPVSQFRERSKTFGSYVFATVIALLTLPLQLAIALVVALSSRGDVFFVQERIGVNRRPFRIFKFRTMFDRAEEHLAQVEEFNESGRGLFKIKKDPRITAAGRFLRRFSLDELPQVYNVLRGEMHMVGPRPLPRSDFENYYEQWHYSRHSGKPGLTCLWQVSGRSHLDFHNMCILDVFYLRNQNWVLDLKIVLRTVWVVIFAKGAY